jgi:hypothetical protein
MLFSPSPPHLRVSEGVELEWIGGDTCITVYIIRDGYKGARREDNAVRELESFDCLTNDGHYWRDIQSQMRLYRAKNPDTYMLTNRYASLIP